MDEVAKGLGGTLGDLGDAGVFGIFVIATILLVWVVLKTIVLPLLKGAKAEEPKPSNDPLLAEVRALRVEHKELAVAVQENKEMLIAMGAKSCRD